MSNHVHLVIETPSANLVEGMKWLLGVYTARYNRRHKVFGHLFSGRYKALIVDGSGNGYLKSVCDYVHLNPVRAGLLRANQPLETYRCLLRHPTITKATMRMKTKTCLPSRVAPGQCLLPALLLRSCVPLLLVLNLAACAADSSSPSAPTPARIFDVRQFGARGDGKVVDTAAIQKALDECGQAGGGTVRFPAGTYLSQPITLRSKTTLLLDQGATLKATDDPKDYLPSSVAWEDILQGRSKGPFANFVNGKELEDVTITGKGTIDGSGARWWAPAEEARRKVSGYTLPRPNLMRITGCKRLTVRGVTLQNSPKFHLVPDDCEDVVIENVTILAPAGAANTDAIDPTMSRRVTITKCLIDVGDDNVAIKSGKKMPGREFACEDLTITDCIFKHGHGLSIGSETAGGVRNLTVKRCSFEDTENGIRIKSPRGKGGKVENLVYEDITMKNVAGAITFTCYYPKIPKTDTAQAVTAETPSFRNIRIRNLTATSTRAAGVIIGLPESPVSNVVFENVQITAATTGLAIRNAKEIQLKKVQVTAKEGPPFVAEDAQVQGLERANQR